jgi:hypothetical protein
MDRKKGFIIFETMGSGGDIKSFLRRGNVLDITVNDFEK